MEWDSITLHVDNAPAEVRSILTSPRYMVGGVLFLSEYEATVSCCPGTMPFQFPAGFAERFELLVYATSELESGSERALQRQYAGVPERMDVDIGQDLPPRVYGMEVTPGTDPARPLLNWQQDAVLDDFDGARVRLSWEDIVGPAITMRDWELLLPPGVEAPFQLPALPAELAEQRPTSESNYGFTEITFVDIDYIAGHAELRNQMGFRIFERIQERFEATGADATIRFTTSRPH
jgi:hypothetical protein